MLQEQDEKEKQKDVSKPEKPVEKPPLQWEPSPPKPDDQLPSMGYQVTGNPVTQSPSYPVENNYPSRRERVKMSGRIPAHKAEKYKLWCFINKVDFQDAMERGLDWVTGNPGDRLPAINDLNDIDDTLNEDVINFYEVWTKNKATEKDRKAYEEVSHLAPHIIRTGILISVVRAKNKINSFRYCIGAIEEAAATNAGPEYMGYLLNQIRQKM
jgi:hypothetical protein